MLDCLRLPPAARVVLLAAFLLVWTASAAQSAVAGDAGDEPDAGVATTGDDPPDDDDDDESGPPDEEDLEEYDVLPPDAAWRAAIRLTDVPASYDGTGVTVAVLDTGLVRHPDLGDRVKARVDLSPDADGYDRYGHGSHMTGVVAGDGAASEGSWAGAAPDASVVPVKVAGWNGATDVSMVLAALEWIAAHRERYGIRVVNLSYGTDSVQDHLTDPLNHAVQRLWQAGVLVVIGAGNRGSAAGTIEKPGDDPYALTVGAADTKRTAALDDDEVAPFSSVGPTARGVEKPDLLGPGVSIASHRAVGSTVDEARPTARLDEHYFKGTGTSQAAAVVSGVAARMFEADPGLAPDEVKAILMQTASPVLAGRPGAGAGLVDAAAAVEAALQDVPPVTSELPPRSSGLGSLHDSRGSYTPYTDWRRPGTPEPLTGERDALGDRWHAAAWAARPWTSATWADPPWARHTAVASGWGDASAVAAWSGLGWDEGSWTAKSWGDLGVPLSDWTAKSWGSAAWNGLR